MRLHSQTWRQVAFAILMTTVSSASGCVPTSWLPDSSGFVYVNFVSGKNPGDRFNAQLIQFNLKQKTSKVLVQSVWPDTMWPAISPDGKRIAVARFKGRRDEAKAIQIVIFDFNGKQRFESKELAWSAKVNQLRDVPIEVPFMLFWSPNDEYLVLSDTTATGLYNLKDETLTLLRETVPVIHGGSPIRPDSKGLLAASLDDRKIAFMDWAGKAQDIDVRSLDAAFPKVGTSIGHSFGHARMAPMFFPSWWDGNLAMAGFKRSEATYALDTAKKTVTVSRGLAERVNGKDDPYRVAPASFDFPGAVSVLVTHLFEKAKDGIAEERYSKVAIIDHNTGKQALIVAKAGDVQMFLPSPDGKYVALCLGPTFGPDVRPTDLPNEILVIDSEGVLISRITLGKLQSPGQ